jgi:cytochrome c peroxidase
MAGIILSICCCFAFLQKPAPGRSIQVDIYFSNRLKEVQKDVRLLKLYAGNKASLNILKKKFLELRISYKQLAILSEYFNPYESRLLNGPAISWSEDDVPDVIIPPHGMQAIESLLFGKWEKEFYQDIEKESDFMLSLLGKMENETDRILKFKDELVWDAIRASCIRIAVLDLTGYESPVAQYSIPEALSALKAIRRLVAIYVKDVPIPKRILLAQLNRDISNAERWLATQKNFNQLDRLNYITTYNNSLYRTIVQLRKALLIKGPGENYPYNADAESFFSPDFMNINFFSPSKEYWLTTERIQLGKKLFYDPILSSTKTRSCGSCHKPGLAFTDGLKTAFSLDSSSMLRRNTPTLWNSALQTRQFYDSRTNILEDQLDEVVHNSDEMKGSLKVNAEELKRNAEYKKLFASAYPGEKDALAPYNIGNAISSYVRSLVAFNSRFDQYVGGNKKALNNQEKNGFNLFAGKGKCATCHFIPLYNGLVPPKYTETESEVLGVPESSTTHSKIDPDKGKYEFTKSPVHQFSFKTPTIRNVALTAPYMHNGVYKTLKEVMDFYNNGGGAGLHINLENQTLPPEKLNLTQKEISDIIAFMGALTDTTGSYRDR